MHVFLINDLPISGYACMSFSLATYLRLNLHVFVFDYACIPCHLVEDIRRAMLLRGALADPAQLLASSPVAQTLLDKLDINAPRPAVDSPQASTTKKREVRKQVRQLQDEYNIRQSLDRVNLERARTRKSSDQKVQKKTWNVVCDWDVVYDLGEGMEKECAMIVEGVEELSRRVKMSIGSGQESETIEKPCGGVKLFYEKRWRLLEMWNIRGLMLGSVKFRGDWEALHRSKEGLA